MAEKHKQYIGDGVYVEWNGFGALTLSTERAEGTHWIVLEGQVWANLVEFAKRTMERGDSGDAG